MCSLITAAPRKSLALNEATIVKLIRKYTGETTYMFPNGALATKEAVLQNFPSALTFTHIVETDENNEIM